jgi:hypothetical protein
MKNHLPFLVLILWQTAFSSMADETNRFFYTYEKYESPSEGVVNPNTAEEAKRSRESLPVNDFPEGNWGQPFHGIQLSLRFEKTIYTNGEPITAILLARNVTNHYMSVAGSIKTGGNGPIDFIMTDDGGHKLSSMWENVASSVSANPGISIPTQAQRKFYERLDKIYDLTNGTYLVQASLGYPLVKKRSPEGKPLELEWKQITSAPVQIKIEDSH